MIFYRVCGIDSNENSANRAENRREERRRAYEIATFTEEFNESSKNNDYYFLIKGGDGTFEAGIICDRPLTTVSRLEKFLGEIEIIPEEYYTEEITFGDIASELSRAARNNFVRDDDEVLELFGISDFGSPRLRSPLRFDENMIREESREELAKKAEHYTAGETFAEELDRIYEGSRKAGTKGHPVHYLLQTDDTDIRRELPRLLMSALYMSGRIENRRYCYTDIVPDRNPDRHLLDELFRLNEGGTLIIRYCTSGMSDDDDDDEESNTASGELLVIERICEFIRKYRNSVLTILCLPKECHRLKSMFYENLGNLNFVELEDELVHDDRAIEYLKGLARNDKVRINRFLTGCVEEGRGYQASELRDMYEEWYNNRLRTMIYPQYHSLSKAKVMAAKETCRGSAYDELTDMIGLKEAKKVIDEALAFYKAQKLYADLGMKKASPSMHMIFSGNPGTAKTSVARLFAKILRDNKVLSRGQCVEVGRSDLVGKYVGWTAPIVKRKFKEAEGGVLFIDEAYSLVDGCENLYGDEAINTIVQEMENHREDVIVIFAGYPDKMEEFLKRNPGLRSRIAFHVPFVDYNADELCRITELMSRKNEVSIDGAAMQKLHDIYEKMCKQKEFGNGRFARNMLERARMKQALRLSRMDVEKITKADVTRLIAEDFEMPAAVGRCANVIGF